MAENKRSFILYADIIHTVKKMPKGKQADLFMTILKYVNDENPVVDDLIVGLVWEPIKLQLKRDLKDWEDKRKERSEAGKKGMERRWGKEEIITKDNCVINPITKITVNDTVNVTVNDINNKKNNSHEFVCYDAEKFILNNRIVFEKICIATGKTEEEVKTFIHEYHLWMAKKEQYPVGNAAVVAGAESWILNAKNFNKSYNGKSTITGSKSKIDKQQQSLDALQNIGNIEFATAVGE